jgi:cell division septum initiation protein DivIVA
MDELEFLHEENRELRRKLRELEEEINKVRDTTIP